MSATIINSLAACLIGAALLLHLFTTPHKVTVMYEEGWSFKAKENEVCVHEDGNIHCRDRITGESTRIVGQPTSKTPYGWEHRFDN